MITCIHQRRNGMTYFDVPLLHSLLDIVCTRVEYGSTIFTDEYIVHMTNWKNMVSYTEVCNPFAERICKWYCTRE